MSRSTLLATAQMAIEGYNTWTPEAIMAYRAPDCIHQILPASLNRLPLNNEQYAAYFVPIMPAFRNFRLTAHSSMVDEAARKVVLHVSSTAATDLGSYENEYMLILQMTSDGCKVERFFEFVDSAYATDYMRRLRDHVATKEKGEL